MRMIMHRNEGYEMHIRYIEGEWGDFFATTHGLIAHTSEDMTKWLNGHPEYRGGIWFNYADGSGEDVDVTETFFPEREDA